MNVLRFRRNRNRQQDPFLAEPTVTLPRFADPHGVATDETLDAIAAQAAAGAEDWWGLTEMDVPPAYDRPYVPGVLGGGDRLSPARASVEADLDTATGGHGGCPLFRDTVRSISVRAEPRHDCGTTWPSQLGTWQERYAAIYRHRTGAIRWPDFGFASELRARHREMAAVALNAEEELYGATKGRAA